jgi:hypothetical protein
MARMIAFNSFSQCGSGKAHNEDAVLLDGQVHQGLVREHGAVDTSLPCHFAVADGVSTGTLPRTASRRLLELLQTRLAWPRPPRLCRRCSIWCSRTMWPSVPTPAKRRAGRVVPMIFR